MSDGMLVRYDDKGQPGRDARWTMPPSFRADKRTLKFRPYDIIFIPGSKMKTIGIGLLDMTDTMVMRRHSELPARTSCPMRLTPSAAKNPTATAITDRRRSGSSLNRDEQKATI